VSSAASAAASFVSPSKTKAAREAASPLKGVHKQPVKNAVSPLKSAVLPGRSAPGPPTSNLARATPQRRVFVQPPFTPPDDTSVETMLKSMPGWTTDGNGTFTADVSWRPGMRIPARFWASKDTLRLLVMEYLKNHAREEAGLPWPGGFLPGVIQLAQVAHLPGAVGHSLGMPDIHSGYGFAIGGVAAMDLDNNESVVSPGGVGFDINCGVRLLKTNLKAEDVMPVKEKLADMLFKMVPVGVGEGSCLGRISIEEQDEIMRKGMKWCEEQGYCWPSDREHVEEGGSFEGADPSVVSPRCKKRGLQQCGSLGAGNHYAEVQVVEEVFDAEAAAVMGLTKGTVVIMMHSGSRGLGHQICSDATAECERLMKLQGIQVPDRQLACCRINSRTGQRYLAAMKCAANYAFVNRSLMARAIRQAFEQIFGKSAKELEMDVVYDVSHNICKEEIHTVNGVQKRLLVHRKGATRAFPPGHPEIPAKYALIGQPVLVGGSMGTCSYVLTGTQKSMELSFGSTCHGAGRCMSRKEASRNYSLQTVREHTQESGTTLRIASQRLAAEEFHKAYKDVNDVVDVCHSAGLSKKCVKLRPLICIKG